MDYRFEDVYSRLTSLEAGGGGGGTNGYTEVFATAATEWVVSHNLGTFGLMVQCWDGEGAGAEKIMPASIIEDTTAQMTIDWGTEEVSGRVAVVATS